MVSDESAESPYLYGIRAANYRTQAEQSTLTMQQVSRAFRGLGARQVFYDEFVQNVEFDYAALEQRLLATRGDHMADAVSYAMPNNTLRAGFEYGLDPAVLPPHLDPAKELVQTKTLKQIKDESYACFNHLTSEARKEQLNIVDYIERMAIQFGVDMRWCNMFKVFGNETQSSIIMDKAEINKRLLEWDAREKAGEDTDLSADIAKIEAFMLKRYETERATQISNFEYSIQDYLNQAQRLMRQGVEKLALMRRSQIELETLQGKGPEVNTAVQAELIAIAKNRFWKYSKTHNNVIHYTTRNDCIMGYKNAKAKIDYTVNLGLFVAQINPIEGWIKALPAGNNLRLRHTRTPHPYIDGDAYICWGNASDQVAKLLKDRKYNEVMTILQSLLTTWSPDSTPFQDLGNFHAIQEQQRKAVNPVTPQPPAPPMHIEIDDDGNEVETCDSCDDPVEDCNCTYCEICQTHRTDGDPCDCCLDCRRTSDDCTRCRECEYHDGEHASDCSENESESDEEDSGEDSPF